MSQKIQKYIFKNPELSLNFLENNLRQFLLFQKFLIFNCFFAKFDNLAQFKRITVNFSLYNSFFKHTYLIISKFLFKKLKKRKWKYKKKKLNKIKILRKLRKSLIHKKFKKLRGNFLNLFTLKSFLKKKLTNFSPLINKIPLTQRVLNNSYLEFFYKFKKDIDLITFNFNSFINVKAYDLDSENFTIYLRNYHQKPYWKFRLARIIHWDFFFKKKKLKKQRYKSFLVKFLKNYKKYSSIYIYFINLFILNQISWTRIQKFTSFLKDLLVINLKGQVYLLPVSFLRLVNWKKQKKKSFKIRKKIGKWSYLNFRKFQQPWLQKKKNFPKIVKHLKPNISILYKTSQYDPGTGALILFNKLNDYDLTFSELLKVNYLTKLHGYRYNV